MLNAAYAYLAEQAEHADAMAEPAYRVAKVEQKDIEAASRRKALDDWLEAPSEAEQRRQKQIVDYITGRPA